MIPADLRILLSQNSPDSRAQHAYGLIDFFCSFRMKRLWAPLTALAVLPLFSGSPAHSQAGGLSFPNPGVVCDSVGQTCYDSYGPSIGITQMTYGAGAADRLTRNLNESNNRDFRLSTGQACVVAKRTCYNDGWNQSQVAPGLTQQLFGGSAATSQKQVARDTGLCSLTRAGQKIYDGACTLKQVRTSDSNRYEVVLNNGSRYVFQQQGGGYVIRDGFGGSWPVNFVDHGDTGIFRFDNYKLVATQDSGGRRPASKEEAVGNALGNLLNSLFK